MDIGLNAHLLSSTVGYRSAGIHSYIEALLRHLPAAVPADWHLTAFVGAANNRQIDGMPLRRSRLDTESPLRRILWEQALQPFALSDLDLYHALAYVAPLVLRVPSVVTIYDLSFIHYPQRLPAARRLYLRLFTGLTCRRARRVIAISHSTARDLVETLRIPAAKIDVAAPGYDPAIFHPLPADQIAYVGDRMDNDIAPALAAGLVTVFVRRGPWGYASSDDASSAAHLRVANLDEIADRLAAYNATTESR